MNYRILFCALLTISSLNTFTMDKIPCTKDTKAADPQNFLNALDHGKLAQIVALLPATMEKLNAYLDATTSVLQRANEEKVYAKYISTEQYKEKVWGIQCSLNEAATKYCEYLRQTQLSDIQLKNQVLGSFKYSKGSLDLAKNNLYEEFLTKDTTATAIFIEHPCSGTLKETAASVIKLLSELESEKKYKEAISQLLLEGYLLSPSVKALHSMLESTQQRYASKK